MVDQSTDTRSSGVGGPRIGVGVGSGGSGSGLGVGVSSILGGGGGFADDYTVTMDILMFDGEKPAAEEDAYDAREVLRRLQPTIPAAGGLIRAARPQPSAPGGPRQRVVADHLGDRDPEVGEDLALAPFLRRAMAALRAPALDRRLVAPERQRDVLAGLGQALEALDRDEPVDPLELGPQLGREVEVVLRPPSRIVT